MNCSRIAYRSNPKFQFRQLIRSVIPREFSSVIKQKNFYRGPYDFWPPSEKVLLNYRAFYKFCPIYRTKKVQRTRQENPCVKDIEEIKIYTVKNEIKIRYFPA